MTKLISVSALSEYTPGDMVNCKTKLFFANSQRLQSGLATVGEVGAKPIQNGDNAAGSFQSGIDLLVEYSNIKERIRTRRLNTRAKFPLRPDS